MLDIGCGTGEILVRAVRRHRAARGLGVDLHPDAISAARDAATDRRVDFEIGAAEMVRGRVGAVINVAASHALGGFPTALDVARDLAPVVLYGKGFWRRGPSDFFLHALGGATADELSDLDGLHAAIHRAGFEVVHESLASDQDWAHYEETLADNAERHGAPDTLEYARRIRHRRQLLHGTDTLGFALTVLRA